ncbi:hypothetical protein WJU70_001008 [Enterobacter cloacae]|uniref:hypothetical protein n=1 Tax=Enterobacter cloacae TaxID=550 RepID=UPI0010A55A55|nr:hypothetical protein [Enterobacter cloacae]MCK7164598.1 hypothetical protein [Enterobacter cloacae]MCL8313811.1 hypothetical protein [Enterobacter cloacae subsp. cloacae]QCC92809.1 hypothetical protein E7735_18455 [Enterobacter cloacae]QCC97809.1 hypothetical protein E7739_18150 [Enterobacter cloacae]QCD10260.1 hypothetical protein E7729_06470 [Enterobacter cloacae]
MSNSPGRFFPLDEQGFILNDTDARYVSPAIREAIVSLFQQQYPQPNALRAVYLRGSIARGTFVAGLSDLDAFAVVDDAQPLRAIQADEQQAATIRSLLSGVTELEFTVCRTGDVTGNPLGVWPFFIKTQSLLLAGENFADRLAPYRPGVTIMGEAMWLPERLREYERRLTAPEWVDRPQVLCEWLMKAIVRAAFELTMERHKRYTRDLSLCLQAVSEHFPAQGVWCRQAVEWVLHPPTDLRALQPLLSHFCPWIEAELRQQLRHHQIDPARYQLASSGEDA